MKQVLVTRPAGQEADILERLAAHGLGGIPVPSISIAPGPSHDLTRFRDSARRADWLVVTSANGAAAVADALGPDGLASHCRVAAVGPATASALGAGGIRVDAVPDRYLTVAIADALGEVVGQRILLARADAASSDLREALEARGALVDEVVSYRIVEAPVGSRDLLRRALAHHPAGVLFTSGSTVRGLMQLARPEDRLRITALPALCIGPVTAEVATRAGFRVAGVAEEHTVDGLARVTAAYFAQES